MDIQGLKAKLEGELELELMSASVLLGQMRVIEEKSRKTFAYNDNRYAPFYYYLGKHVAPNSLLEIGFRLGLLSGCFLKSCKTVKNFLGYQFTEYGISQPEGEFYSPRLGIKNLQDCYDGKFDIYVGPVMHDKYASEYIEAHEWDLVIVNEEVSYDEHRLHLDLVWPHISMGGLLVMDYVTYHKSATDVYNDFCRSKNREPVIVQTRYGTGLIEK